MQLVSLAAAFIDAHLQLLLLLLGKALVYEIVLL